MRTSMIAALIAAAVLLPAGSEGALAGDEIIATGSFKGVSGHQANGTVTIRRTDQGVVAVLEDKFNFDGAPDPKLGFGKDGRYDKGSQISPLGSNSGHQVYEVPAAVDAGAYNQFYVWCERYSVPLGVADLN